METQTDEKALLTARLLVESDHTKEARDTRRRLKEAGLYPTKEAARQAGQMRDFITAYLGRVVADLADDDLLALFVLAGTLAKWKGYDLQSEPAQQHAPSTITAPTQSGDDHQAERA